MSDLEMKAHGPSVTGERSQSVKMGHVALNWFWRVSGLPAEAGEGPLLAMLLSAEA